jgi:hypothetical protein
MDIHELTTDRMRFPLPLMAHFLEIPSRYDDDLTICETPYETNGDGAKPTEQDYIDDEDVSGGAPTNTAVIADSNDKEDADYDV